VVGVKGLDVINIDTGQLRGSLYIIFSPLSMRGHEMRQTRPSNQAASLDMGPGPLVRGSRSAEILQATMAARSLGVNQFSGPLAATIAAHGINKPPLKQPCILWLMQV